MLHPAKQSKCGLGQGTGEHCASSPLAAGTRSRCPPLAACQPSALPHRFLSRMFPLLHSPFFSRMFLVFLSRTVPASSSANPHCSRGAPGRRPSRCGGGLAHAPPRMAQQAGDPHTPLSSFSRGLAATQTNIKSLVTHKGSSQCRDLAALRSSNPVAPWQCSWLVLTCMKNTRKAHCRIPAAWKGEEGEAAREGQSAGEVTRAAVQGAARRRACIYGNG